MGLIAGLVCAATTAFAESEAQLGAAHTVSLSASFDASGLSPEIDWFVARGLSIGARIGFEITSADSYRLESDVVGVALGYALPVADRVRLWPRIGVDLSRSLGSMTSPVATDAAEAEYWLVDLDVYVPVTVEVVPHLYFGFGPQILRDLEWGGAAAGSPTTTRVRLETTIGGWF